MTILYELTHQWYLVICTVRSRGETQQQHIYKKRNQEVTFGRGDLNINNNNIIIIMIVIIFMWSIVIISIASTVRPPLGGLAGAQACFTVSFQNIMFVFAA